MVAGQKFADELTRWGHGLLDFAPSVSADGSRIDFRVSHTTGFAECAITREALEVHFWLSPRANPIRMLKAFDDGRNRIVAVAERKMRTRPGHPVLLTSRDFDARR